MIHKIIIFLATWFLLTGESQGQYCTNDKRYTEVQFFDSSEITIAANVQFGTAKDHQGTDYPLRMDLYYPNVTIDQSAKRPFIMLFHGGGFSSGDKQSGDIRDLCVHLALRGYVCASVNYRLGHDFSEYGEYKARYRGIQDGHAALRYIVNNAQTIRVDTNWLFVGGQSAGSILALGMVYADPAELDSVSLLYQSTAASAELGNLYTSGNNLTNTYTIKGVFNNWGGVAQNEIDPEEMLPTIAFHGEKDTLVQIDLDASLLHYQLSGSRALYNTLIAKNICSEITIDTLGGHGIYRNASSLFRAKRASCFFKSIFCKQCSNFYSTDSIPSNCSSALGIDPFVFNSNIQIYPNPFENILHIAGGEGAYKLYIYNSLGQLVSQLQSSEQTIQLDLTSGIYFLKLSMIENNKTMTFKLIRNE